MLRAARAVSGVSSGRRRRPAVEPPSVGRHTMRGFSGRGTIYLAVASMLGWIIVLREVLLPLVPSNPISQAALIAGSTPLDRRLVLGWCLGLTGALMIGAFFVIPLVRRQARRRRGLCVVCGYDVSTGDTRQSRCPECGALRAFTVPPNHSLQAARPPATRP